MSYFNEDEKPVLITKLSPNGEIVELQYEYGKIEGMICPECGKMFRVGKITVLGKTVSVETVFCSNFDCSMARVHQDCKSEQLFMAAQDAFNWGIIKHI
jgi:hypothetical protein